MRLLSGLVLAAGLGACAHAATGGATAGGTAAEADDQASAELKEHHRHHHRGGVVQFIAMSLDTLGTDEAKASQVDKLQSDLYGCMAPARENEKKLLSALADGVATGTIEAASIDPILGQIEVAAASIQDCSAEVLNKLHALLSPTERATLAEKVQAHWEVWHQSHDGKGSSREKGGRLARLAEELSLSPDQVEKIAAAGDKQRADATPLDVNKGRSHVDAFAAAFTSESFDSKSLIENANVHLVRLGGKRMAAFYQAVAPALTPEQRTKLAEHLRERASQQPVSSN